MVIEDEDKDKVIILSSLSDEDYETFVLTLINSKRFLSHNEAFSALLNQELRRKDKESSNSTLTEVLTVRGRSFSRKSKGDWWKIKVLSQF